MTKTRTIVINVNDVMYDVDAATHLRASSLDNGENSRLADAIRSDRKEAFSATTMRRYMEERLAEVRLILADFASDITITGNIDDRLKTDAKSYTLSLTVDESFLDRNIEAAAQLIHRYIATGVTADWMSNISADHGKAVAASLPDLVVSIKSLMWYQPIPKVTV